MSLPLRFKAVCTETGRKRKKHSRTIKGKLCQIYSEQRGKSIQNDKYKLEYSRQEFYERFLNDEKYLKLFSEWEKSGFKKDLAPSVDRINPSLGYSMKNIQMITWYENHQKSRQEHTSTSVLVFSLDGKFLGSYDSVKEASKATNTSPRSICGVCTGRWKQAKGFVFKYRGDKFHAKKTAEKYNNRWESIETLNQREKELTHEH